MAKEKKSAFEKLEAEIVHEAGEFVKEKVKRKVLRIGEISILIILGFMLISFGIASLLANYYPILSGGYSYLLIGVLFLIISYIMKV